MTSLEMLRDAIALGVMEVFTDPDGVERIRLTPAGARSIGQHGMARVLEECKSGRHSFAFEEAGSEAIVERPGFCICGGTRAPQ